MAPYVQDFQELVVAHKRTVRGRTRAVYRRTGPAKLIFGAGDRRSVCRRSGGKSTPPSRSARHGSPASRGTWRMSTRHSALGNESWNSMQKQYCGSPANYSSAVALNLSSSFRTPSAVVRYAMSRGKRGCNALRCPLGLRWTTPNGRRCVAQPPVGV